jgi:hypothetical protein
LIQCPKSITTRARRFLLVNAEENGMKDDEERIKETSKGNLM